MSGTGDEQLIELLLYLKKATPDAAKTILNGQPQISYALISLMAKMGAVDAEVMTRHLSSHGIPTGNQASLAPETTSQDSPYPYVTPAPVVTGHSTSYNPPNLTGPSTYTSATPFTYGTGPQAATMPSSPAYVDSSAQNISSSSASTYPQQYAPPPHASLMTAGSRFAQPFTGSDYNQGDQGPVSRYNKSGPPAMPSRHSAGLSSGYGPSSSVLQPGGPYGPPPSAPPAVIPDVLANVPPEQRALLARVMAMTPDEINRLPLSERTNVLQLRATLGLT